MSNSRQDPPRHDRGSKVAGQSAGGRYKDHIRTAASLMYSDAEGASEQRNAILARLAQTGSVPATTVESATDPKFTDGIDVWWSQHFERMEQPPEGKAFKIMPDDYTPKETGGLALSGKRRTHRIRYSGAGVELRMPSATSIRRFSAENGKRSFDVPIELEHGGGKVSGFVRVTQGAAGVWDVQALNFPGQAGGRAAEAVAAVLEARRPSLALRDAERQYEAQRIAVAKGVNLPTATGASALHQRRINRTSRAGVELKAPRVPSAVVTGGAYDHGTNTMMVRLGKRTYGYQVDPKVFREVMGSGAPGRAYNELVKNRSKRVELKHCNKCSRWSHGAVRHACPAKPKTTGTQDAFRSSVATMLLSTLKKAA
ncbi:hypothetical protein [Leucobacter sp. cx-169]|uniref:hypothetical protein n=1 Tax=Leucobacter sp. cx-169 TaxID=2770549 RepID=UPI00165DBE6D|nr:hypothetical protein [Leucobacter sp. cx-169]MBC9927272.1 hypothetical protein [Leucobacter sp. cx-169]